MSELSRLAEFLEEAEIPQSAIRKRTLFDISGFPHYETVISNWYRYFLDDKEDHRLGNLFLRTLTDLAFELTNKAIDIRSFEVITEVITNNKKRIDILIQGTELDDGKYIIIENKVFHRLNNDLLEYWQSCESDIKNKIGIVLSLVPKKIPENVSGMFFNMLHSHYIEHVKNEIQRNNNGIYPAYLDDFLNAINNLSIDLTMTEEVLFYYNNIEKCNRIYSIADRAYEYIIGQFAVASQNQGLSFSGRAEYYRYLLTQKDGAYYTLIFDGLFEPEKSIQIVIELYEKGLTLLPEIDGSVGREKVEQAHLTYKPHEQRGVWLHYASKRYSVDMKELKMLADFIVEKVNEDFSEIMNQILQVLSSSNK